VLAAWRVYHQRQSVAVTAAAWGTSTSSAAWAAFCARSRRCGRNDAQGLAVVSKPAEDVVAAPEVKRVGGVSVQLDIAVERRRSFWWRLVAKLQFFRS
jgi:hypothetical protein